MDTGRHSFKFGERAFSLVEIVLAIAIISFALVAIIGLFPVALDSATSSQRETQAALIARTIYTDLGARSDTKRFLITSADISSSNLVTEEVDLKKEEDHYLAYDMDGAVLGATTAGAYSGGKADAGFLAHVVVKPLGTGSSAPGGLEGLSEVKVTVETPAAAAKGQRATYPFITWVRQGTEKMTSSP